MSLVDLHLHLLPDVDDGPATVAASVEHAVRLARDGVHDAVVTPHVGHPSFAVDVASIALRTASLQRVLDERGVALRLRPGGEIHPGAAAALAREELDLVAQGPPGARWVLLEAPFAGVDGRFGATIEAVRSRGFGVLVGHPERAAGLLRGGLDVLFDAMTHGAVLQVSVCSLLGRHGAEARTAAELLVRRRLAYVLASDGHGGARSHTLALGAGLAVRAGVTPEDAVRLTAGNPRFLLRDGILPQAPLDPARIAG